MSQPERPAPLQPPFLGHGPSSMAQIQRPPTFPMPSSLARPEQRPPGPQLAPIHSIPSIQQSAGNGGRSIQLPPMQIPPMTSDSPPRTTTTRSIPVSHLLSANPPSPPRSQPPIPVQQTVPGRSSKPGYVNSPVQYRPQVMPYPTVPPYPVDQPPIPFRQPPPQVYPTDQYPRPQYSPKQHQYHQEQLPRQFSPATSIHSSHSYTHSEASPRSSIGPLSQSGSAPKSRVSLPPPLNYTLSIRQQPVAARACGFGERDRRVIDPPPILELKITDQANGYPAQDPNAMLALNCTLLSPDGHQDETELPPAHPEMPSTRRLMGTLVASPYQAKDENGIAGTFFTFPDLSCRSPGKYRLRFKLLRVDPMNNAPGAVHGTVARIVTDVFSVYTAKDFPGMRASSALLKALRRQGLNVGVKKGSEARKGKGKAKKDDCSGSSDEEEDDSDADSSSGMSPKTHGRKKGKRRKRGDE